MHKISATRWSVRIDGVRPFAKLLNTLKKAAIELSSLSDLTVEVKSDLKSINTYINTFECILMHAVWIKIFTMIYEVNLMLK